MHEPNQHRYDVIVIGAGVSGSAIARELSRFTLHVLVVEEQADVGSGGASKANTAIVHSGADAVPGTQKAHYNVLGNAMFPALCEELSVPFVPNTSLIVAFEGDDLTKLDELKHRGEQNGVPDLRILDKDELFAIEPDLSKQAVGALLMPSGGITCPFRLTVAFAENAATNGVSFLFEESVSTITPLDGEEGYCLTLKSGTTLSTKAVVNSAGMSSAHLHNQVCRPEDRFEMRPRRGEYFLLDPLASHRANHPSHTRHDGDDRGRFSATIFQLPSDKGKGVVLVQTVDGNLLVGPTAEELPPKLGTHTNTTPEGLARLLDGAKKTWPEIPLGRVITSFSGVRARTTVGDFIIGPVAGAPHFWNAAGIESPGLTSAPAIGVAVAEMVAEALKAPRNPNFNPVRNLPKPFSEATDEERRELIAQNPHYAKIICRCEMVTEAEVLAAIHAPIPATTLDALKRRVRAGAGRCQAGFCTPRMIEMLSEELGVSPCEITKFGEGSRVLSHPLTERGGQDHD